MKGQDEIRNEKIIDLTNVTRNQHLSLQIIGLIKSYNQIRTCINICQNLNVNCVYVKI